MGKVNRLNIITIFFIVTVILLAGCQTKEQKKEERENELIETIREDMQENWEERKPFRENEEVYVVYGEINTVSVAEINGNIRLTIYGFEYISSDSDADIGELLDQEAEGHSEYPVQPFVRVVEVNSKGEVVAEEWY